MVRRLVASRRKASKKTEPEKPVGLVTLVSPTWARKGAEFTYVGPVPECEPCKVFKACQNLQPNRRYKVVAVRDKVHDSFVFEGGARVVEVELLPIEFNIPARKALGTTYTHEPIDCDYVWCPNWKHCFNPALEAGESYRLDDKGTKVECPKGYDLIHVRGDEARSK